MAAQPAASVPPGDSTTELQERAAFHLSHLGGLAASLQVVLVQDHVMSQALLGLGFASVLTSSQLAERMRDGYCEGAGLRAVLIFCAGDDVNAAVHCCGMFAKANEAPPLMVLMASVTADPYASIHLEEARLAHKAIMDAGADDFITLARDEALTACRVREALDRTQVLLEKVSQLVRDEVEAARAKAPQHLQSTWRKCMSGIPSAVLVEVPVVDEHVDERSLSDLGLREYQAEAQLSSSPSCMVVRARHPKRGQCALKARSSSSHPSVSSLLSFEKEFLIVQNIARHPHVVHAYEAFQTPSHSLLVMDYVGDHSLHSYTLRNAPVLPPNVVEAFSIQEAAAVRHLHRCLVCHMNLQPSNFVVSQGGRKLTLVDMSSAFKCLSRDQRKLQCSHHLPFAAPEVLRMQPDENGNLVRGAVLAGAADQADPEDAEPVTSCNGFDADIWSLGVNFADLACGVYSTEKNLGWIPAHPATHRERIAGVESLAQTWSTPPTEMQVPGLHVVISRMLVLRPDQRWTMDEVVERGGLRLEERAADPGWNGAWVPPA